MNDQEYFPDICQTLLVAQSSKLQSELDLINEVVIQTGQVPQNNSMK